MKIVFGNILVILIIMLLLSSVYYTIYVPIETEGFKLIDLVKAELKKREKLGAEKPSASAADTDSIGFVL